MSDDGFIPPHGGYRELLSYQKARIVYRGTEYFCGRWIDRFSRTRDQMLQAARSGKQNIVEGSVASATSKETELKLTNVARSSFEELLEDYLDFLTARGAAEWPRDHRCAKRMRQLVRLPGCDYDIFRRGIEGDDPVISANIILGLTRVTCYLLDRQIAKLEADFIENGGLREAMTRARLRRRR
ncbi:MAG TPA: four helix bundle suffix domain-containing protein [Terriglobales bacterium]|nr:four helix bundle suffix domain-containing protein [Terriglobales bacterium]